LSGKEERKKAAQTFEVEQRETLTKEELKKKISKVNAVFKGKQEFLVDSDQKDTGPDGTLAKVE
jgi:hypothetical protein